MLWEGYMYKNCLEVNNKNFILFIFDRDWVVVNMDRNFYFVVVMEVCLV